MNQPPQSKMLKINIIQFWQMLHLEGGLMNTNLQKIPPKYPPTKYSLPPPKKNLPIFYKCTPNKTYFCSLLMKNAAKKNK